MAIIGTAHAQTTPAPAPTTPTPPSGTSTFSPSFQPAFPIRPPQPNDAYRFGLRNPERLFPSSRFYENTYEQVQGYGRCVTSLGSRRARDVLTADPNTVDELNAFRILIVSGRACLSYGYQAPTVFLRAGLAEALFKEDLKNGGTMPVANTATTLRFLDAERERSGARLVEDYKFTAVANCIVLHAPAAVKTLLLSKHGSPEEAKALEVAVTASPTCTTTRQLPQLASRSFIRAYLAESAYRWERTART
jgi:hypothetical protein